MTAPFLSGLDGIVEPCVREWSPRPTRPDNHWFDYLVGCAAAASMCGVKAPGEAEPGRARKRYTQDDLRRR